MPLPAMFQKHPEHLTPPFPNRWCDAGGELQLMEPPASKQQISMDKNWRMVGGQLWFFGDDRELPPELPINDFRSEFVPKELRGFDVLHLDADRRVWTLHRDRVLAEKPIRPPFYLCGLPVIMMLPISPISKARGRKDPMEKVRFNLDNGLESKHTRVLCKIFPFAAGFCIWMNGHLQLLTPQLSEEEVSQLTIPSHVAGLEVSVSRWTVTPTAIGSDLDRIQTPVEAAPRVKIGNAESIAGVKVRGRSGKYEGQDFLTLSTHAVFEGITGKGFRTRRVPRKRDKVWDCFNRMFGSKPSEVKLGGIEIYDLHGNVIGRTIDELIYDGRSVPSNAVFPDDMPYDLCLFKLLSESPPSIHFPHRPQPLTWYLGGSFPSGRELTILDDDGECEGKSFKSGLYTTRINVKKGGDTVVLPNKVLDSAILFRRNAKPLEGKNCMSGAAVLTKDNERKWNQVVGFQSFQFVPPGARGRPEQLFTEDRLREDIKQGNPLNSCICGARPVHQDLKHEMEIINGDFLT